MKEKKELKEIVDRFDRGYTNTLYGNSFYVKLQKDTDFERLIELVKKLTLTDVVKSLNLEVKPTFEEWLNVNFTKYDNEYYQDSGRNGIWKKHQLYELYENTTL